MLDDYGLVAAIDLYGKQWSSRTGIDIIVRGPETDTHLPAHVENAMFRIVQESLTNVVKHAKASQVIITVGVTQGKVDLSVEDNGIGYDMSRLNWGKRRTRVGLGHHERASPCGRGGMPCPVPAWIRDPVFVEVPI